MFKDNLFLGYARHMEELNNIAEYIMQAYYSEVEDFSMTCLDNLTPSDIEYIEGRLRKYGFDVKLTID